MPDALASTSTATPTTTGAATRARRHAPTDAPARTPRALLEQTLPSGRRVAITHEPDGERLAIHDPHGRLELSIALTDAGPVVTVRGAPRLELEAPRAIALRAERIELETSDAVCVRARGEIALETERALHLAAREDVVVRGNPIRLN